MCCLPWYSWPGLALLLYPTLSNSINARHQSHVVSNYEADAAKLTSEDYAPICEAAIAYNMRLPDKTDRFLFTDEDEAEYNSQMNPTGNGIIGFIEIDSIAVKLPIYHGTDDSVLQVGAGHVEGTSLPVGGEGTHCAISGHRGLPSALLFTDLDQLVAGDVFTLHTLNDVLTYQVDQVSVVEPSNLEALDIVPGMDYCTLITCTPYGINSHRLMVRGVRIENAVVETAVVQKVEQESAPEIGQMAPALLVILILGLVIGLLIDAERKTRRREDVFRNPDHPKHTREKK